MQHFSLDTVKQLEDGLLKEEIQCVFVLNTAIGERRVPVHEDGGAAAAGNAAFPLSINDTMYCRQADYAEINR
uniref:Uncharacterized protein n=1 Tax=Virgibacillus oceani TaxID=1479511 RepID=A0A917HF51_9BACI|nr:hypothetical protein GCM10011398_21120 [Virgibacillus oceani]